MSFMYTHLLSPLIPGVQHHLSWSLPLSHMDSTNPDLHTGQQAQPCGALTQLTVPTQPMSWDQLTDIVGAQQREGNNLEKPKAELFY